MRTPISKEVAAERERCACLAEDLAGRWERSAIKTREDGSFLGQSLWSWPPFRSVPCVKPKWEEAAKGIEAAAHGLRTVARGIREGWDDPNRISDLALYGIETRPTRIEQDPQEKITRICSRCTKDVSLPEACNNVDCPYIYS